jgi:hypothetical protein
MSAAGTSQRSEVSDEDSESSEQDQQQQEQQHPPAASSTTGPAAMYLRYPQMFAAGMPPFSYPFPAGFPPPDPFRFGPFPFHQPAPFPYEFGGGGEITPHKRRSTNTDSGEYYPTSDVGSRSAEATQLSAKASAKVTPASSQRRPPKKPLSIHTKRSRRSSDGKFLIPIVVRFSVQIVEYWVFYIPVFAHIG